jgi:hypothetical protein
VAEQKLNLFDLPSTRMAQLRARSPQIVRRDALQPRFFAAAFTTYQTTFWEIALPQTFPVRLTLRKIFPSLIPAATVHSSSARFAHSGIGTVRMCPPLPIKSTTFCV